MTRCALQLAPLVFLRPGELRKAEWSEIDLEAGEWRIPAERMKMKAKHIVPLLSQAVAILRAQPRAVHERDHGQRRFEATRLERLGNDRSRVSQHGVHPAA